MMFARRRTYGHAGRWKKGSRTIPAIRHPLQGLIRMDMPLKFYEAKLGIELEKIVKGTDQDQNTLVPGIDIQAKLSPDVVSSTSKPQTTSSSSQVSQRCSACMQIIQSDKTLKGSSDQYQTNLGSPTDDIQEKLSPDIVCSTPKPHQGKHFRSSSKMRKAFQKKKKKKSS